MKIEKYKDPVTRRYKWRVDFTCANVRHKAEADSTEELYDIIDAIKRRARAVRYGLPVERETITLKELVEERKKDFNLKKSNDRMCVSILDKFCAHLGEEKVVHLITTADLRSFVRALRLGNHDLLPVSVNNYLTKVGTMLRKAGTYFSGLSSWKAPDIPYEGEGKSSRERVISEEEIARLFYQLRAPQGLTCGEKHTRRERPAEVRVRQMSADIFDLSLMTGMRKTETRTLTKTKIDWTVLTFGEETIYGFIQLPATSTKTKEPRRIPLNWDARQILERRCGESQCQWVFPNTAETAPIAETVIRNCLHRIARRAKVPFGRKLEDGFVYHDSRHTAATRMLERGAHLKTVGRILGHRDETMTMRYVHTNYAAQASAVASLGNGSKKGSKPDPPVEIPPPEND